ncbi:MAG: hypothetical protein ABI443_04025 [Chthoniobacterales bacterium]
MRYFLLLTALVMLAGHSSFATSALSAAGKLELFVNGKNVPVSSTTDPDLYRLFGDLVHSATIVQELTSGQDHQELHKVESCHTRLIFTAARPFIQSNAYGRKIVCQRLVVSIPKNHLPQIVAQGPKKTYDLSSYSLRALQALINYPKINKPNLPEYSQLKG